MQWHDIALWEQLYVDLWSIPHFLIGVIIAFIGSYFGISNKNSFIGAIVITTGWELLEFAFNIEEFLTNRFTDVLFSLIGLSLAIWLIKKRSKSLFITIVIIYVVSNLIGWMAWIHHSL